MDLCAAEESNKDEAGANVEDPPADTIVAFASEGVAKEDGDGDEGNFDAKVGTPSP